MLASHAPIVDLKLYSLMPRSQVRAKTADRLEVNEGSRVGIRRVTKTRGNPCLQQTFTLRPLSLKSQAPSRNLAET